MQKNRLRMVPEDQQPNSQNELLFKGNTAGKYANTVIELTCSVGNQGGERSRHGGRMSQGGLTSSASVQHQYDDAIE